MSLLGLLKEEQGLENYFLSGTFPNEKSPKKFFRTFKSFIYELKEKGINCFDIIEISSLYFIKKDVYLIKELKKELENCYYRNDINEEFFEISQDYVVVFQVVLKNGDVFALCKTSPAEYLIDSPEIIWKIKLPCQIDNLKNEQIIFFK